MQNDSQTNTISTPMAIIIAGAIIALAVYASNTVTPVATTQNTTTQTTTANPTPAETVTASVSIDDDAILGDPNAPITFIEFSDYECPFCKRHFTNSFPQIKKDYIDTGKVKFIFRDLPLSFHDPLATQQALAANCAREQGGDSAYYAFHDEIFTLTSSNGNGMTETQLFEIASQLGLDKSALESCVNNETYIDEINQDMADAANAGATATPTFFVGLSTESGTIEATRIVGAQPYETVIKPAIEELLQEV